MSTKTQYINSLYPSLRHRPEVMEQFLGALRTRISDRQRALRSRFTSADFIAEDIEGMWPEENMRFCSVKYAGIMHSFKLSDFNLRELDELEKWLAAKLGDTSNWRQLL